ncbi:DNA repair protein RecO [Candidatus Parcubacteria bacterium]|nr:DNA repair protein RecO [Patescibacteria group bacterium]MBU4466699.1 DNA repair protein RecO [Patescibacteria group bacterium]MCG2688032.1 DNA repair protein RecO [Candidatus Parcubacteria bacterium]
MFVRHRSQGYVLKRENVNEADQVFSIYTKDFGEIRVLAKASRRLNSKLRSFIQVLTLVEIEFVQGKTIKTLTDAVLIERFSSIKKNLLKLRLTYNFGRTFNSLVKIQETDDNLWRLLDRFFHILDLEKEDANKLEILYYYFFWNLLDVLGYRPELKSCTSCRQKPLPDKFFWISHQGGLVCKNCVNKVKTKVDKIDIQTLKILRIILDYDWKVSRRLKIDPEIRRGLKIISKKYFNHIYEKR